MERFIINQKREYDIALKEIKKGKKESHWIWYIFPQITGLGQSFMCKKYDIQNLEEAKEYLNDDYLRNNLIKICEALLKHKGTNIKDIMHYDDVKLLSCMTLFNKADDEVKKCGGIFKKVMKTFYDGKEDELTLKILDKQKEEKENKLKIQKETNENKNNKKNITENDKAKKEDKNKDDKNNNINKNDIIEKDKVKNKKKYIGTKNNQNKENIEKNKIDNQKIVNKNDNDDNRMDIESSRNNDDKKMDIDEQYSETSFNNKNIVKNNDNKKVDIHNNGNNNIRIMEQTELIKNSVDKKNESIYNYRPKNNKNHTFKQSKYEKNEKKDTIVNKKILNINNNQNLESNKIKDQTLVNKKKSNISKSVIGNQQNNIIYPKISIHQSKNHNTSSQKIQNYKNSKKIQNYQDSLITNYFPPIKK